MNVAKTSKGWRVDIPASKIGKRTRLYGATREEVMLKAEKKIGETGAVAAFGPLDPQVHSVAARWSAPGRLTAEEIETACREYSARKGKAATAADAIAGYLTAPREVPLSIAHLKPLRVRLNAFRDEFGKRPLAAISAGELKNFCRTQGKSAPNYFSAIRALFNYSHSMELIALNPFDKLTKPEVEAGDKEVLTPDQMLALLKVASVPLQRYLIAGGLCGLRHSESMRQQCEDIDRQSWEIHVRKMKTSRKGIRERYAATEANAQAWLNWFRLPEKGPLVALSDSTFRKHRLAACAAVGLDGWPDNALRRSFASYHLAAFENAARTAEVLGHTDAETTKSKYQVARKKEIALAWFALMPPFLPGGF
jgi:integrase